MVLGEDCESRDQLDNQCHEEYITDCDHHS